MDCTREDYDLDEAVGRRLNLGTAVGLVGVLSASVWAAIGITIFELF